MNNRIGKGGNTMGIDSGLAIFGTIFTLLNAFIILAALVLGIYSFVLFVKLAKRGIKALDIYNKRNGTDI